jgi:hypothetical protein
MLRYEEGDRGYVIGPVGLWALVSLLAYVSLTQAVREVAGEVLRIVGWLA